LGKSTTSVEWWLRPPVWPVRECEARQARVLQEVGLRRLLACDSDPAPVVRYG
jgi:hypothetical protein